MKRFLSMLATLVLVGQSVVTPAVYAMQGASENEESVSEAVVETTIDEPDADDGSSDDDVVADVDDSTNDAEESAGLEESADAEETVEADNPETSEESEITEEDETSDVAEAEKVEEETVAEETSAEDVEESSKEEPVSYGKSFSSEQQEKSWTEISENRLVVTAIDSLGAFPEGTKMVVKAVEEEHVFDLVNDAIDANVTKVKAVDITFWYNEEEVQPEQPINVKISALNMAEPQTVVHIDAEYNDEKIEVGEADVEEINSEINGKTAEFEAESFSIYAIASVDRLQVNFKKADGSVLASGVIRNTADLESFIYYPEVSDLGENEIFRGWNNSSEYTTGTSEVDVKAEIESKYGELVANEDKNFDEIDFYAMIFNKYTITYQDENGAVILKTDEALFKAGEGGDLSYLISMSYVPNKPNQKFEGWKVVAGEVEEHECQNTEKGVICEDNKSITIKGDLTLNANVLEGHWLVFNENGKWATYVAPQFVETDVNTEAPSVEMKRPGFSFDGWFEGTGDDAPKFTFGQKLTTGTTVYAHWTTGTTADYTVLIWKQNVSGSGYDFVESVTVEDAEVGSTPSAVNTTNGKVAGGTYNGEIGFKFKETDQASKTVATEGNTVVNVYYDRNTITFKFNVYDYTYTPTTSDSDWIDQYGLVDGDYVKLTRYNDGSLMNPKYRWTYGNNKKYEGTRYTRSNNRSWNEYKTMEGLYGSTLADNDYTWPEEYDWYSSQGNNGNPTGTRTTFLDAFLPTSSETTVNFYADDPEGSNHIYFYKQNADGNGYTLANTVNTDAKNFNLSDKYNGFECVAWNTSNNTSNWNEVGELMNQNGQYYYDADPKDGGYQTASIGSNGLHIYFDRKEYSILFNDGAYVDGNGNPIDDAMNRGKLYEKENITYGKNISSYLDEPAENLIPAGYVFGGWYTDDAGTALYSGNTMPEGLTLYAKWIQKQYRVFLHPNADEDNTLDWGSDTQAMNFRVSYGATVSTPTGKRSEYEFIGWFTDDKSFKNPFNSETRLTDANTSDYDKETDLTDPMDKWGNGATENHDTDRSRITKKLDLYGKWRSKLEGASGMNVIYDAGEGSNAPEDDGLYLDKSEALAGLAATAPSGKQFKYWVVQKWNGSAYVDTDITVYPGETFEVLKVNAKKEVKPDNTPENPSYTYTIQLRAEYKTGSEQEETAIQYCPNYDGAGECTTPETIDVNVEFTTTGEIFTREGYTFSGWNTKADGKGTDFGTGVSGLAADNLGVEDNKVNVLYAIWKVNNYDYTVEYYYNNVKDETKTETGNAEFNSTIRTYTDKVEFGYTLSGAEGLPLTITANPENNIIKVYYKIDENQKKEISYTVEYYKDEVLQTTDTVIKTESVQVLQPDTLTFDRGLIDKNKYTGYTLSGTKPDSIGDTVNSGDTIKVYYVKRNDLHYTVNYLEKDTNKVLTGAKTVEGQIFGSEITSANEKVEISGYNYDSADPETLTIAEENNVINVYYTKKNNLSYVVHYYEEGTMNRVAEDKTKTNQTFGDEVKEIAISIDGYNTTGDAEKTIIIAEEENEITFYYKKRTDLSYTVYYKLQGTDKDLTGAKTAENQTFGSKVTENAVTIEGYTVVAPSTAEIEITTGTNEYTFYYKANEDTEYKVEHYLKDLNADTYTLTGTDNLSGVTNEVATATQNTYEGFTFDENNKNNVLTGIIAADGSLVLKVYYKRDTHIVIFDETGFVCEYGDTVAVPREIPTKTGDAQYSYTFAGWQRVGGTESGAVLESGTTEVICEDVTYQPTFNSTTNEYLIRFVDEDGTELQSGNVAYGVKPEYNGNTPEKEADTVYTYAFSGWAPEVVEVTGEATYTATYLGTYIDYTVTFGDDSTICHSGSTVAVPKEIPTKTGDAQYSYTFAGWKRVGGTESGAVLASGTTEVACENATYEPTFDETVNEYTIKFVNEDGTELQSGNVAYGVKPEYNGNTPEKEADTVYTYAFSGWTPEIVEVTGEATYTATYSGIYIDYTVTFDNTGVQCHSGEKVPVPTYIPTKDSDETYTYEFAGWKIVNSETTSQAVMSGDVDCENIEYESTFKGTYIEYSVKWMDDNTELSGAVYHYNDSIVKLANPTKSGYVFSGWDPTVAEKVTGDATYTAEWKDDKNNNGTADDEETFTVIYKDGETELKKVENLSGGDTLEAYTPTKKDYVFDVWTPEWKATVDAADANTGNEIIYNATWKDDKNNNGIDDTTELVAISFKAGDHGKLEKGTTGYTTEKTLIPGYDKYPTAPSTTADEGWKFTKWSPDYKAGEIIPLSGAELEYTAQWEKVSNGGGGGGGGGGSSSSYRCENLPENAVANNTDKPNRNTDYSYSDDTSKVCTFQCKSGYTRDKDNKKCVKSENPGGGDGGEEEIELGGQVSDKCSVEGFEGSEEEKAAYLYACENDITTIRDINEARLKDFLTRAEMAKMVSVFATKELGMKPNKSKDCSNFANSISHYNQEMKDYMVMSCQLEIMGIHTTNYKAIPDFMPSKRVSRAEFGTILSRVLWGNKYEGTNENYYINHLNALKENNIITNINPNITEYRAWVFLMLYRAVEAIKVLKSTNNVAIDQQVNEELQEEGKAETGLVVEYDSGSVVPDMATVTESGTLATGAVAKVESGNVAESQTGATTLTGEDASKEVSAETGVVAETGSTSD